MGYILHRLAAVATAAALLPWLAGCSGDAHEGHDHEGEGHDHTEELAEEGHDHDHEGELPEGHHEGDGHDHSALFAKEDKSLIELPAERAKKLGVATTGIAPGEFSEVLKVSGELSAPPSAQGTVTARSAGIVALAKGIADGASVGKGQTIATVSGRAMAGGDANETARVALQAAKRELDRLTPLHADGIVTTRDYNAALQRYEEAKAAASGAGASGSGSAATAPVGGVITALYVTPGQYVDAGQAIASVSGAGQVALRADVPENRADFLGRVAGAKFRPSYSQEVIDLKTLNGRRTSGTANVAQGGVLPVWFAFDNRDGRAVNGSFCEVYLLGQPRQGVISVPVEALSEQQGRHFVYKFVKEGHYTKVPVTLGATDGQRVEIVSGLAEGDRVVTSGTTFVRLAETSNVAPPGHTHNH